MSQADKLLDTLSGDGVAAYTAGGVAERHIVIDADRFITVPEELKRIGVENDHNIETVTFDCPRYWDEHDLSTMVIYINYVCANGKVGSYPAKNVRVDDDDDTMIHFDWVVSNNVTQGAGNIAFLVCAKNTDDEGNLDQYWNSERNTDMYVSEGLEVIDTIVEKNPDILTHILLLADKLEDFEGGDNGGTGGDSPDDWDDSKLSLSGGTMTGPIVMPKGDVNTGVENGEHDKIFGYGVDNMFHVGDAEYPLMFHGVALKPMYNGYQLALESDVDALGIDLTNRIDTLNSYVETLEIEVKQDIETLMPKIGDVVETYRTDLGDKWLLCNGVALSEAEYPALWERIPYNTSWVEDVPINEYEFASPIPNTHKWVRVKRKTGTGTADYAWDKAEVYDVEARESVTVECPLVLPSQTVLLVGITHDGEKYVLAAVANGEVISGRYTMHLYKSDDLTTWKEFYTYTFKETVYPSDITFDGVAYLLLDGYVPSDGSTSSNYVRYVWATPADLSKTERLNTGASGYKHARFVPCPQGFFSVVDDSGDVVIRRAGTGEDVMSDYSSYSPSNLAFFNDRYAISVTRAYGTSIDHFTVFDFETGAKTTISFSSLLGLSSTNIRVNGQGAKYDKNLNEWVFWFHYSSTYYAVTISADSDPTLLSQYTKRVLKSSPGTDFIGQMSLNRACISGNKVYDPSVKYLPTHSDETYKYVYANVKTEVPEDEPDVPDTPIEPKYMLLEYLESYNQAYTTTGVVPNQDTRVVAKVRCPSISATRYVFGVRSASGTTVSNAYYFYASNTGGYGFRYNDGIYPIAEGANFEEPFVVDMNKNVTTVGDYSVEAPYATFTAPGAMTLFGINTDGSFNAVNGTVYSIAIYYCQIYDNDVLIRDFVPVRRLKDGELGMYDRLHKMFYVNITTSTGSNAIFTAGPEVGLLEEERV